LSLNEVRVPVPFHIRRELMFEDGVENVKSPSAVLECSEGRMIEVVRRKVFRESPDLFQRTHSQDGTGIEDMPTLGRIAGGRAFDHPGWSV